MRYDKRLLRHFRATIGQNLHRLRVFRKITLERLSRVSGLPVFLLDQFELGKNTIGTEDLLRIACALGVNPAELMKEG